MTKECIIIKNLFYEKFGYFANVPFDVIMEDKQASKNFCEVLNESIKTGVDKTINKYSTDPNYGTKKFNGIYID